MSEIEILMNLRHPWIADVIGFLHPLPFLRWQIVRMHAGRGSLSEVISASPRWWTPTAKAKTIAGLALGLRFAHSFGILHGHLTMNNVLFDECGMIQIVDFCLNHF
jgi:serine/threonine protein kinase